MDSNGSQLVCKVPVSWTTDLPSEHLKVHPSVALLGLSLTHRWVLMFPWALPEGCLQIYSSQGSFSVYPLCLVLSYKHQPIHILNNSNFSLVKTRARWAGCWEHRDHTALWQVREEAGRGFASQNRVSWCTNARRSVVRVGLFVPGFLCYCESSFCYLNPTTKQIHQSLYLVQSPNGNGR